MTHSFYQLKPIKLGCEVRGIQLGQDVSSEGRFVTFKGIDYPDLLPYFRIFSTFSFS